MSGDTIDAQVVDGLCAAIADCYAAMAAAREIAGSGGFAELADLLVPLAADRAPPPASGGPIEPLARLRVLGAGFFAGLDRVCADLAKAVALATQAHAHAASSLDLTVSTAKEIAAARRDLPTADGVYALLAQQIGALVTTVEVTCAAHIAAMAVTSLSPTPPGTARSRISRRLGRDRQRTFRRLDDAHGGAWRVPESAVRQVRGAAAYAVEGMARLIDEVSATLQREHHALAERRVRWNAIRPLPPMPYASVRRVEAPSLFTDPLNVFTDAVSAQVVAVTAANRRGFSPHTPHSYRRDARTMWGRSGFVVHRDAVAGACAVAWNGWLAGSREAITGAVAALSGTVLGTYLRTRDETLRTWQEAIDAAAERARSRVDTAGRLTRALAVTSDIARALRDRWCALHRTDPATGLSLVVRSGLTALAARIRVDKHRPIAGEMESVARGAGELRLPVVASMKAGKSTLLCALLGIDVVPRRSQAMTMLATRYVLRGDVDEPVLRVPERMAEQVHDLVAAILAELARGVPTALAGQPHLARFVGSLRRAEPIWSGGELSGTGSVRDKLVELNDLARLATLVLPAPHAGAVTEWVAEVAVPAPSSPVRGGAQLVLIDTPGPDEASTSTVLREIVNRHLAEAHGCLIVVDYTQMGGIAEARLAELVKPHLDVFGLGATWIAVNRVDQRRSDSDRDPVGVRHAIDELYKLPPSAPVTVVETSAELALATAECEGDADGPGVARVLALAYPHGRKRPASAAELRTLLAVAERRSGLTLLRDRLTNLRWHAPALAVASMLARVEFDARTSGTPSDALVQDVRWGLQEAMDNLREEPA